jgi:hypothetical protein
MGIRWVFNGSLCQANRLPDVTEKSAATGLGARGQTQGPDYLRTAATGDSMRLHCKVAHWDDDFLKSCVKTFRLTLDFQIYRECSLKYH